MRSASAVEVASRSVFSLVGRSATRSYVCWRVCSLAVGRSEWVTSGRVRRVRSCLIPAGGERVGSAGGMRGCCFLLGWDAPDGGGREIAMTVYDTWGGLLVWGFFFFEVIDSRSTRKERVRCRSG